MSFRSVLTLSALLLSSFAWAGVDPSSLRPSAKSLVEASARLRQEITRRSAITSPPQDYRFSQVAGNLQRAAIDLEALLRKEGVERMELKRAVDRVTLHSASLDYNFTQSTFGTVPITTPVHARVRDELETAALIRKQYDLCCRLVSQNP